MVDVMGDISGNINRPRDADCDIDPLLSCFIGPLISSNRSVNTCGESMDPPHRQRMLSGINTVE